MHTPAVSGLPLTHYLVSYRVVGDPSFPTPETPSPHAALCAPGANCALPPYHTHPAARPILIVDEDHNSVFYLRCVLHRAEIHNPIVVAATGAQAIDYLSRCAAKRAFPCVVLLDAVGAGCTGLDVLGWARTRREFANVAFVMISDAEVKAMRRVAAELRAAGIVAKEAVGRNLGTLVKKYAAGRSPRPDSDVPLSRGQLL